MDDGLLVTEVFSAIQGEGALVGRRQVFVRLTGCPYRCAYCDQPEALEKRAGPCLVEQTAGRRDFATVESPLPDAGIVDVVDRLWRALPHHSVSITGGEPLMQSRGLTRLLPLMAARGHRLYLETSGTLVDGLARVLPWIDHVSMDVKLTSVDGQRVDLDVHRRFLDLARARDTFVKIVVGPATDDDELAAAVAMVHAVAPDVTVFLQPVTPFAAVATAPTPEQVLRWQERALRAHADVRVVPQTHKMIDQR
ncbi:MAG TPA: 7-carboxy-7-deazaguanine synthase QueE [Acidimicrobiales bacterium]|nr:7-carboxy-7-deazaguanine synthase QueE [Acidimicrobiales bacterium]